MMFQLPKESPDFWRIFWWYPDLEIHFWWYPLNSIEIQFSRGFSHIPRLLTWFSHDIPMKSLWFPTFPIAALFLGGLVRGADPIIGGAQPDLPWCPFWGWHTNDYHMFWCFFGARIRCLNYLNYQMITWLTCFFDVLFGENHENTMGNMRISMIYPPVSSNMAGWKIWP